jgi:putative holliday junction resolvase
MMIFLGLDVGEKTIGVAASDALGMIATPITTITRRKLAQDMAALQEIIARYGVCEFVVGMPLNMDGSQGSRAQSVRSFAHHLRQHFGGTVHFWDERMSSQVVEKVMLSADMSRQKRATHVDKLAASYILQGFLDANQRSSDTIPCL